VQFLWIYPAPKSAFYPAPNALFISFWVKIVLLFGDNKLFFYLDNAPIAVLLS